jgi:hypothetical protein
MSTRNFCDACGKELSKKYSGWAIFPASSFWPDAGKYDLCFDCSKAFEKILANFFKRRGK